MVTGFPCQPLSKENLPALKGTDPPTSVPEMGAGARRIQPKACAYTAQSQDHCVRSLDDQCHRFLLWGYHGPVPELHTLSTIDLNDALFLGAIVG